MAIRTKIENPAAYLSVQIAFALLLLFWGLVAAVGGQTVSETQSASLPRPAEKAAAPSTAPLPVFKGYKAIHIGMSADEVRDKLGKPESGDDESFYYEFSGEETAQILFDADKKVRVISIMYMGDAPALKFEDVFGKDVPLEEKPDKSIYKMVRYPEAGYWVAYSRTAGENPIVTVTMQKL